jgi:hypothetical protein
MRPLVPTAMPWPSGFERTAGGHCTTAGDNPAVPNDVVNCDLSLVVTQKLVGADLVVHIESRPAAQGGGSSCTQVFVDSGACGQEHLCVFTQVTAEMAIDVRFVRKGDLWTVAAGQPWMQESIVKLGTMMQCEGAPDPQMPQAAITQSFSSVWLDAVAALQVPCE